MANMASTSYCIEGSKKDLKRLYKLIDGFMTGKEKPFWEDSAENWLGNVIKALGATEEQMKNNYLRGFSSRQWLMRQSCLVKRKSAKEN